MFYLLENNSERAAKILSDKYKQNPRKDVGMYLVLLDHELGNHKERDNVSRFMLTTMFLPGRAHTQELIDAVTCLVRMLSRDMDSGGKGNLDLAAADRAYEMMVQSLDLPPILYGMYKEEPGVFNYVLGAYLMRLGRREEAINYWKKSVAETQQFGGLARTLAGAKLCDLGIKPESYKNLWLKEKGE